MSNVPRDVDRCHGFLGDTPCPSCDSCSRYVQLPYRDERPGLELVWLWVTEPDPEHPDRCEHYLEASDK